MELHFCAGSEGRFSAPAPTPAVPVTLADDPVTRADTPLHLEDSDEDEDSDAGMQFIYDLLRFIINHNALMFSRLFII